MQHHPDNFRSALFRSLKKTLLSGCQDPSDHVEPAAVRRYTTRPPPPPTQQQSTALVSVGCGGHRAAHHRHLSGTEDGTTAAGSIRGTSEAHLSRVSREAEKLQMVVDLWTRQQVLPGVHHHHLPMDVAEGLLRGAMELQESLALLRELQEASRSRKRRSRRELCVNPGVDTGPTPAVESRAGSGTFDARNYQRIYDNPFGSASGNGRKEFRKFAIDGLQRQCLPVAASSSEENTSSFTQSLRFTSSSGSVASCSNLRSKSDSSDDSSVSCHHKNTKAPNLIVKLMGLEDAPTKAIQPVDKQVVVSSSHLDAKMPKATRKFQRPGSKPDSDDGKTFQEMIDTLQIKGRTKGRADKVVVRRASMDDSIFLYDQRPPIVVIKPMLRSFDQEIMRKDIHVDNGGSSNKKQEAEASTQVVVDKEIVLDQNKKTLVRMLEGKEKRNEKAGKMEPPNKNKLPHWTKALTTTPPPPLGQKASTKPRKLKNHGMPGQMPAVTTPSRRKVEEIKNIKKTVVVPPAEVRRDLALPIKVQKQQLHSAENQAVQKTSSSSQNRDSSADPVIPGKEKKKTRSRPHREIKPQRELNMASLQNNSKLEDKHSDTPGNANPSPNTVFFPASCLPEIEKQECIIPREDVREHDSNSVNELVRISIHDVETPFLSQEASNRVDDPNSLEKPECSPCHEAEFPSTSQEDGGLVSDRITVISEADAEGKPICFSSPSSVNNADEAFDPDETQSADLRITPQDIEVRNSRLLLDCCFELSQCRNYHVKLSNLAMLRSHAQNTYSLYSQDQLDEEIRGRVKKFRTYLEPAVDTASLGGLYWRLQMDLNCNGLMGIGGWDCGWIDGISVEQVEQIVSDMEECIACKLIEEVTLDLVSSPV